MLDNKTIALWALFSLLASACSADLQMYSGTIVVRVFELLQEGGHGQAYLLRQDGTSDLFELQLQAEHPSELRQPGHRVLLLAAPASEDPFLLQEVALLPPTGQPQAAAPTPASSSAGERSGGSGGSSSSTGPASQRKALASAPVLQQQQRVVEEVPTLYMIASDMCGMAPATTVEALENVLFGPLHGAGTAATQTLQGYYTQCSHGKAFMNRTNSLVVGPVPIPCSLDSAAWNFTADDCTYQDTDGWHRYAQQYVQDVMGIDITSYKHRVLLLPSYLTLNAGCPWSGLGTLGPAAVTATGDYAWSEVWVAGEEWNNLMPYMHEVGHTNYLHHASTPVCEDCDKSCPMGGCCQTRCFNAPHSWQLGWSKPLGGFTLSSATLPAGVFLPLLLPATHASDESMIIVTPDWTPGYSAAPFNWFLSYRVTSGPYDSALDPKFVYATSVHRWSGVNQTSIVRTMLAATVFEMQEWRNSTDQLVVRQTKGGADSATISICRWSEAHETSCGDGLDNDCDGLIDHMDPDCSLPSLLGGAPASPQLPANTPATPSPTRPNLPSSPGQPPVLPPLGPGSPMQPPALPPLVPSTPSPSSPSYPLAPPLESSGLAPATPAPSSPPPKPKWRKAALSSPLPPSPQPPPPPPPTTPLLPSSPSPPGPPTGPVSAASVKASRWRKSPPPSSSPSPHNVRRSAMSDVPQTVVDTADSSSSSVAGSVEGAVRQRASRMLLRQR